MNGQSNRNVASVTFKEGEEHLGVFPKDRLVFNKTVSDWCLRGAARCIEKQAMEEALQWDALAARVMSFECASLASAELEKQLVHIGRSLKTPATESLSRSQSDRWVHVLTEVYPDGGHSGMLRRWIEQDPRHNRHSIVLLAQAIPVPEALAAAVQLKNGKICTMDIRDSLISRVMRLREIVSTLADVVVLHTHPWDVIAPVALSIPGGPPVLLVNHAAHIFWTGASVADVILNCRYSPQEDQWTARYRGNNRIMHLPIPLSDPDRGDNGRCPDDRREIARKFLNLPKDALVMLTVGIGSKYTPFPGVDFLQAVRAVLMAQKNAYLVAVGPKHDAIWMNLRDDVSGRLILVDKQPAHLMPVFFDSADIYLEGFPFGSTTSLLEAGLCGIASVLPPKMCPPPFTSDGIALQMQQRSSDLSDYVQSILTLLNDKDERMRNGRLLAASVRSHHCGSGWVTYLEEIQNNLPAVHDVCVLNTPENVPEYLSAYWTAFSYATSEDPLAFAFRTASEQGLKPMIDRHIISRLIRSGKHGRGRLYPSFLSMILHPVKQFLFNVLRPVYILLKSMYPGVAHKTERAKIICQTVK